MGGFEDKEEEIDLERLKDDTPIHKIDSIDDVLSEDIGYGSVKRAASDNLYGISHTGTKSAVPENRNAEGYVFFTRPQLNLSEGNLYNVRKFFSLLTTTSNSIPRYVRMMLDGYLKTGHSYKVDGKGIKVGGMSCDLLNNSYAFIPVLTNNLKTISGWPDIVMPTFTSKSGVMKEQQSMADGSVDIYESYDIDVTFRNTKDEPIIYMMQTWIYYMYYVYVGKMAPYDKFIGANEMDYNTRIWRLVTDETYGYLKHISCTGASFPINVPTGKLFDITGNVYDQNNKDINIRFKCDGAMYDDDILVKEFNEASYLRNSSLREVHRNNYQYKEGMKYNMIPGIIASSFNHRGTPLINPYTLSIDWWINISEGEDGKLYRYLMDKYKSEIKDAAHRRRKIRSIREAR